jgi:hypothetical protein
MCTRHCGHQWPILPVPGDYDDGEIGGMIGRGNQSTRRKPAPLPLCPPQTPHAGQTRTRAATVGSQRLTAWATARPIHQSWLRLWKFCCWILFSRSLISGWTHSGASSLTLVWRLLGDISEHFLFWCSPRKRNLSLKDKCDERSQEFWQRMRSRLKIFLFENRGLEVWKWVYLQ